MEDFYIITPQGKLARAEISHASNGGEFLKRIARAQPVVLPDFPKPGYRFKATGNREVIVGRKLDSIVLNTHFAPVTLPDGTPRITPVFYDNGISIKQTLDFIPPPGHEFWFFLNFSHDPDAEEYLAGESYMCWHHVGVEIYRPPFSNTYEDGRICMGYGWEPPREGDILEKFESAVDWFQSAESNNDLRPSTPPTPLLMWDPATMKGDLRGFNQANIAAVARGVSNFVFDGFFE